MASIPAGAIVAYAGAPLTGTTIQGLAREGWLVCDGKTYGKSAYPDLSRVLGDTWGKAPERFEFVVPDLRSRFLRGSDQTRKVGAAEGYATAAPTKPFLARLWSTEANAWQTWAEHNFIASIGLQRSWWAALSIASPGRPAGGDPESYPVHAEVVWLVAHSDRINGNPVPVPVDGVVSSVAEPAPGAPWRLADSSPDLRGIFLRGSADGTATKLTPIPYATGWPQSSTAAVTLDKVPVGDTIPVGMGCNERPLLGSGGASFVAHVGQAGGGDAETRPANLAADHMIATQTAPNIVPGMIVAFGGPGTPEPAAKWRRCDGLPATVSDHPELAQALPWAVTNQMIAIPNVGFVRGTDRGSGRDPDAGGRTQPAGPAGQGSRQEQATGNPSAAWQLPCNITNRVDNKGNDTVTNQSALTKASLSAVQTTPVSSARWDAETRPANRVVSYWICAKP